MRQLYFRFILGVLAVLLFSFTLPPMLFGIFGGGERPPVRNLLGGSVEIIKNHLENVPLAELDREIDSLRALFHFPMRLVDSLGPMLPGMPPPHEFGDRSFGGHGPPHHGLVHIPLQRAGKTLIVGPLPDMSRPSNAWFILHVSLVLGIVGVAAFLVVAPVARNLRLLETAALHFGQGDLDSRAAVKSRDAVGGVADRFNKMAGSIQQLIHREHQLLQAVSHELRTPIARIRFGLDLLANAKTKQEIEQRISEVDREITEIDQLVGELLDYNRFQSESVLLDRQPLALRPILEDVIKRLHDFRPEIDIRIDPSIDDRSTVVADTLLFRRAMQNLVSNALRYAKSRVEIAYLRGDGAAVVQICDDGPGIPPEQREHILKPFYRVDQSGSKESGGVGLGLAIVNRIIELHQGSLEIDESDIRGARFTTRWPEMNAES